MKGTTTTRDADIHVRCRRCRCRCRCRCCGSLLCMKDMKSFHWKRLERGKEREEQKKKKKVTTHYYHVTLSMENSCLD